MRKLNLAGRAALAAWAARVLGLLALLALLIGVPTVAALAAAAATDAGNTPRHDGAASMCIERNVYAAGGQVRPSAPVPGDFSGAGGRVLIEQPISGDAALAGGSVEVRAPIGEDLRVGGGDVRIEAPIGGELRGAGGHVQLGQAARVSGNATLYAGELIVEGRVEQALTARARRIVLDGEVGGDADLAGGEIELGPKARIGGALRYASGTPLKRAEGAVVSGAVTQDDAPTGPRGEKPPPARAPATGASWVGGTMFFLGLVAFAALLLLVAPSLAQRAALRIRAAPGASLGWGLLVVFGVPVLAALLFITLVGIPLGILVLSLYPLVMLLGLLLGAMFIAGLLRAALRQQSTEGGYALNLLFAALALLLVVLLANVPVAGGLALALITLAGLGALVLDWRERRRGRLPPAAPPQSINPAG